jgi:adenylate cyclase
MIHQRQLAAIMFTDIVGYSAMMQQSEEQAVLMIRRYIKVLHDEVSAHHGKVLNDYGDGSLCIFTNAVDALQCSIAMHSQYRQEPAVPLRIGLHIGEIFFEDDKVMGDAVNVASRVQSMGIANTVLASSEVVAKIRNRPEFQFVPLGTFEFKNIEEPLPVFALKDHDPGDRSGNIQTLAEERPGK